MANSSLRKMFESGETFWAPAAYDGITAQLAKSVGFRALYVPGSLTGVMTGESEPLATLTQLAVITERISDATAQALPIIVDIMAGFGNPIHVQHAVRTLEDAGATAVHIEDQIYPGRVHYLQGTEHVVSIEEYRRRIEYAVKARRSGDFLIIARNDVSRAVEAGANPRGEAVQRAHAAIEMGADAVFITGIQAKRGDFEFYRREIPGIPMVVTAYPTGTSMHYNAVGQPMSLVDYNHLGYQCILYGLTLLPALRAIHDAYTQLRETGRFSTPWVGGDLSQLDTMLVTNA